MQSLTLSLLILICCGLVQPPVWCSKPLPPQEEESAAESEEEEEEEEEGEQEESTDEEEEAEETPKTAEAPAATLSELDKELLVQAREGDSRAVKKLLDKRANINAQDNQGNTPLMLANLTKQNPRTTKALLEKNPDFTKQNNDGDTVLIIAARNGFVETIEDFFKTKAQNSTMVASINLQNNKGNAALIEAAQYDHNRIVIMLLNENADHAPNNKESNTALIVLMKYLQQQQSDDQKQLTSLRKKATFAMTDPASAAAARIDRQWRSKISGYTTTIQSLIRRGANITQQNNDHESAFTLACNVANKADNREWIYEIPLSAGPKMLAQRAPSTLSLEERLLIVIKGGQQLTQDMQKMLPPKFMARMQKLEEERLAAAKAAKKKMDQARALAATRKATATSKVEK